MKHFLPTNPKKGDRVKKSGWIWEWVGYCWTNVEKLKQKQKKMKNCRYCGQEIKEGSMCQECHDVE